MFIVTQRIRETVAGKIAHSMGGDLMRGGLSLADYFNHVIDLGKLWGIQTIGGISTSSCT